MTKFNSFYSFTKKHRTYIFWAALTFILLGILVYFTNDPTSKGVPPTLGQELNWWASWFDPIIGMGIFIITFLIGRVQFLADWEKSLDKRLTVYFKYKDRDIMICHKAFLADVADIRNLGQQIGTQMTHIRYLDFEANNIQNDKLGVEKYNNEFIVHHQVVFQLTKLPEPDKFSKNEDKKHIAQFKNDKLIWHVPETKKGMEWQSQIDKDKASKNKS